VEKIQVIHSSGGVYYHHHPFFLSKLTKEGKAGAARTLFCLQKKKRGRPLPRPNADAGTARPPSCLQKERSTTIASGTALASCKHAVDMQKRLDCGKSPAYPQEQMCRTDDFSACFLFVQHRFSIDTMLVQPIRGCVNR
jgi:hypothetical protein